MSSIASGIRRMLPRNGFARSVSILAGGTAAGQLVVILAAPLLTRLFDPAAFGLLAAFIALLAVMAVVASLRYQLAIPLPESDREAAEVLVLCLAIVAGVSLLCGALVALFGGAVAAALNLPALAPYLWLLPIGLLLAATYEVFCYWAIRTKAFPALARTKVNHTLAMVAVQLGGAGLGPLALLLGQVAGHATAAASLFSLVIRHRWTLFAGVTPAGLVRAAVRYRRFPLFSTWGGAFNTLSAQMPPLLLAVLFSPAVAGLYALAQRVLAIPMTLVGQAIGEVFFSSAADARRKQTLPKLVGDIHQTLAQIAMPPALLLMLVGPDLFGFVFGEQWRPAGEFARWMAPWLYFQFVGVPLSMVFDVLEKQPQELLFHASLLAIRVAALLFGAWSGDILTAIVLFALGSAVCYLGLLLWIFVMVEIRWTALWGPSARALGWSALLVSPLALALAAGATPNLTLGAFAAVVLLFCGRYAVLLKAAW